MEGALNPEKTEDRNQILVDSHLSDKDASSALLNENNQFNVQHSAFKC